MSDLKIFAKDVEQEALDQINLLLSQKPFENCKVRIMPDVHAGKGCVIGFTANLGNRVIPNIVGVDIGCGMLTVPLGNVKIDYKQLDSVIRRKIPSGMDVNNMYSECDLIGRLHCFSALRNVDRLHASLGTLGGGNHFIEIDESKDGEKYLIIHSGSRNLGKQVAEIYQNMAIENHYSVKQDVQELIERYKAEGREREISEAIKAIKKSNPKLPKDLCYLEGYDAQCYLEDMYWCTLFARRNRWKMAEIIIYELGLDPKERAFHTVHNYIGHDNIVRKGAISAALGENVLIPMNMRDGCILGVGKGNVDWNCSAPHGAGRIMSRSKAKSTIPLEEYRESMNGIFTTSVCDGTLDEAPQAYKPMADIVEAIKDTVRITKIIKPTYNFKASE